MSLTTAVSLVLYLAPVIVFVVLGVFLIVQHRRPRPRPPGGDMGSNLTDDSAGHR
jgi:hypothetical protein